MSWKNYKLFSITISGKYPWARCFSYSWKNQHQLSPSYLLISIPNIQQRWQILLYGKKHNLYYLYYCLCFISTQWCLFASFDSAFRSCLLACKKVTCLQVGLFASKCFKPFCKLVCKQVNQSKSLASLFVSQKAF